MTIQSFNAVDGAAAEPSGLGLGTQMKVVLKLPGSDHSASRHTAPLGGESGVHPEAMDLTVSLPLARLRPATPSAVEVEESEEELPPLSEHRHHHKHHHKKHKKHKKHSSHEGHPSILPSTSAQAQIHESYSSSNPFQTPTLPLPPEKTAPHSQGSHFSVHQTEVHASPFKFTISKDRKEERSSYVPVATSSSSPALILSTERKSHKHHKKHRPHSSHLASYHHHSDDDGNDPFQQKKQGYFPPGGIGTSTPPLPPPPHFGSSKGKPHAMFMREKEMRVEDESGILSAKESNESMDISSSRSDLFESHSRDSEELGSYVQSHDLGFGRSHHKKKKEKKKKQKHSRMEPLSVPSSLSSHMTPHITVAVSKNTKISPSIRKEQIESVLNPISPPHETVKTTPSHKRGYIDPVPPLVEKTSKTTPSIKKHAEITVTSRIAADVSVVTTTPSFKRGRVVETVDDKVTSLAKRVHAEPPTSGTTFQPLDKPKPESVVPSTTTPSKVTLPPSTTTPSKVTVPPSIAPTAQVKLSRSALKFFLKNLHHLIHKRDPENIFAEAVTDDIAPGYSTIIKSPMDLTTMASKIENNLYPSIKEFKADFILMCNNAMTYNAPDTVYYATAKRLLSSGLQIIAKETSLRPDIRLGRVPSRSSSASPLPPPSLSEFFLPSLPPSSNVTLDYSSPFICHLPLSLLQPRPPPPVQEADFLNIVVDKLGAKEVSDQSHLTQVIVGCDQDIQDTEPAQDILQQVEAEAAAVKENLDVNYPSMKYCFLNQNSEGKTMLNILNPDSCEVDSSKAVDLSVLSDHVRMGNNASTVLRTELPMMKATPVSYLMYGPFGSFAPVYDSTFATLSKMDSDLLLSTYGSELGISYAHSLQQFVKGAGSGFVSEMANAVLNGLTNNRHSLFTDKLKAFEEKENKMEQTPSGTPPEQMETESVGGDGAPKQMETESAGGDGAPKSDGEESEKGVVSRETSEGVSRETSVGRGEEVTSEGVSRETSEAMSRETSMGRGEEVTSEDVSRETSVDRGKGVISEGVSRETNVGRGEEVTTEGVSRETSAGRGDGVTGEDIKGNDVASEGISRETSVGRGEEVTSKGVSMESGMKRDDMVTGGSVSMGSSVGTDDISIQMDSRVAELAEEDSVEVFPSSMQDSQVDESLRREGSVSSASKGGSLSRGSSVNKGSVSRGSSVNKERSLSRGSSEEFVPRESGFVPERDRVETEGSRGESIEHSLSAGGSVVGSRGESIEHSLSAEGSVVGSRGESIEHSLSAGGSVVGSRGGSIEHSLSAGGGSMVGSRGESIERSFSGSRGGSIEHSLSVGDSEASSLSRRESVDSSREEMESLLLEQGGDIGPSPLWGEEQEEGCSDTTSEGTLFVDSGLSQASSLLSQLQGQQTERLSLPPYLSEGHFMLPGPSKEEMGVARKLQQELATLAAATHPSDLVSVSSLHKAMGISVETLPPPPHRPQPHPLPSDNPASPSSDTQKQPSPSDDPSQFQPDQPPRSGTQC